MGSTLVHRGRSPPIGLVVYSVIRLPVLHQVPMLLTALRQSFKSCVTSHSRLLQMLGGGGQIVRIPGRLRCVFQRADHQAFGQRAVLPSAISQLSVTPVLASSPFQSALDRLMPLVYRELRRFYPIRCGTDPSGHGPQEPGMAWIANAKVRRTIIMLIDLSYELYFAHLRSNMVKYPCLQNLAGTAR